MVCFTVFTVSQDGDLLPVQHIIGRHCVALMGSSEEEKGGAQEVDLRGASNTILKLTSPAVSLRTRA